MTIFYQYVGKKAKTKSAETIGTLTDGLVLRQLDQFEELSAELNAVEETEIRQKAPKGFQLWGISRLAKNRPNFPASHLQKDDWVLFFDSDAFYYGGQAIYKSKGEMPNLSRQLWSSDKAYLIVLLNGTFLRYPWEDFRSAFGYKPGYLRAIRGQMKWLPQETIVKSQFKTERGVITTILGTAAASSYSGHTLPDFMEQVELLQSLEGGKLLREHFIRERDPTLISQFKSQLSSFSCALCKFNFEEVYGEIGREFIEAHHVEPIGLRNGSAPTTVLDFLGVCSNCHRMIHRLPAPYNAEEIRALLVSGSRAGTRSPVEGMASVAEAQCLEAPTGEV
jgi:hypothetical protein